ncbi:hypothetical protein LCGC14_0546180 [marine sediment metagenome]|uniref:Uncharacterized protein n=1 Tax=marine sediment metagenome TaxID=412755 RepID=A0A0F9UZL6_9ZZZZ
MGKLVTFITLLIFMDLIFIATGQLCSSGAGCSIGSILLNAILDIGNVTASTFFSNLVGDITSLFNSGVGFAALIAGATVFLGASLLIPSEQRLFIPVAFAFALLTSDFVFIAVYLISLNAILGTFIMAPIVLIYILTVVEWLRGKD